MFSSMRSSFHTLIAAGGAFDHEHVGVHVGEVADEDGDGLAEPPSLASPERRGVTVGELEVGRAQPPAESAVIHHVVVQESERLQQLERGADIDDEVDVGSPPAATKPQ